MFKEKRAASFKKNKISLAFSAKCETQIVNYLIRGKS